MFANPNGLYFFFFYPIALLVSNKHVYLKHYTV